MRLPHSRNLLLDAGALCHAEANPNGLVWELCRKEVEAKRKPLLPITVLAQVWRGGPKQAGLARVVKACKVVSMDEAMARRISVLLGEANMSDVVDAMVVLAALDANAAIVTSDPGDIAKIADALDYRIPLITV